MEGHRASTSVNTGSSPVEETNFINRKVLFTMPWHFCQDELYMIMAMLPFIGAFFRNLHAKYHSKHNHKPHVHEECYESVEELTDEDIISSEEILNKVSQDN